MTNRRQDLFVRLRNYGPGAILHTIHDGVTRNTVLLAEHARKAPHATVAAKTLGLA